jgi:hypothetical protein
LPTAPPPHERVRIEPAAFVEALADRGRFCWSARRTDADTNEASGF